MSWSPRRTRCGSTMETGCGAARSGLPTRMRCGGLAQRLALSVGRRLDEAQPWVDGQLTGVTADQFTVRLHAVLAPIASGGTCLSLRVLRPATQDLATLTRSGAIAAGGGRTARQDHRGPAGVPCLRRHRRRQDHALVGRPRRGLADGTHRLRGGRRRVGTAASAPGEAGRAVRECRRGRRDYRSRPGEAGAADATGPDRRRRGARRGGGRPAGRAQHRPRRWRGNRAREQSRRGARPARGARSARRPRPLRIAQSARGGGTGAAACRSGPRRPAQAQRDRGAAAGRQRLGRGRDRVARRYADSEAAPRI